MTIQQIKRFKTMLKDGVPKPEIADYFNLNLKKVQRLEKELANVQIL